MFESQKPQISHHYDIDVLQWSRNGRVACGQFESDLTATESPQISYRCPIVVAYFVLCLR